jgi:hypothetical protein
MEAFDAPGLDAPAVLPPGYAATQTVVQFRASSAGYATGPADDPPNAVWPARILGDIEISQTAFDTLGIGGRIGLTLGDIRLWDGDEQMAGMVAGGIADGRAASVRAVPVTNIQAGDFGAPLGSAPTVLRGIVRRIEHTADMSAVVSLTDIAERLATPLQAEKFGGTGGVDGSAELAGRPKPIALGEVLNITPVYLGLVDLGDGSLPTYMVHWRAVSDIMVVRIRGVEQAEVGSSPAVGEFTHYASQGVFQLGSTPDGPVTADVAGDVGDAYGAGIGRIIRTLIQDHGPQFADAEIQAASFDFFDTDVPGEIGWFRGPDEITAASAVDEVLAACGGALCGGRDGVIRLFDPMAGASAQWWLPPAWIIAMEPMPLPVALRPLPHVVRAGYAPNWTPMTDLAGSVADVDRTRLQAAQMGTVRASSAAITTRVLQQREMRLDTLFRDEADALARAERWRDFLAASPRGWRITTDRYLGQIECGDLGVFGYPAFGLDGGAAGVVVGWRESIGARRLVLDVVTVPWIDPLPDGTGAWDVNFTWDVTRWA